MLTELDSTQRFTDRAGYYAACRPGYPDEVVEILRREAGLPECGVVADIGSGTGLSAELFLRNRCTVYGVEPNPAMRSAAEECLCQYPAFHSIDGRAEATGLPDAVADLVTCASAFHWFAPEAARTEFRRLLRPSGAVAIIGNGRSGEASDFMRGYVALFRKYSRTVEAHRKRKQNVQVLFAGTEMHSATAQYREPLDLRVLSGRVLSYSTMPLPGEAEHAELMTDLRLLFGSFAQDGHVWYEGEVAIQWGILV